jgi:hypothetical protein
MVGGRLMGKVVHTQNKPGKGINVFIISQNHHHAAFAQSRDRRDLIPSLTRKQERNHEEK